MRLSKFIIIYLLYFLLNISGSAQDITFQDTTWAFNCRSYIIENFKGNNSLYLQGGQAYLPDVAFKNGTIEYDMYMTERVSFAGLIFRISDETQHYEEFYTRAHHSTHPDAYQYTPVYHGMAAWQLYHDPFTGNNNGLIGWRPLARGQGFNGILEFAYDRWVHYKFVIKDQRAEVYIDNEEDPSVVINRLLIPATEGGIGFFSGAGATHFANLSFTKNDELTLKSEAFPLPPVEEGTVMDWEISDPVSEDKVEGSLVSEDWITTLPWKSVRSDESGLLNISRFTPFDRKKNTVLVRVEIRSDRDQVIPIQLGFSDRVKVILNGKAIFAGNDNFRSRDYRYLGTIGYFDTVYLDVKKGNSRVYFAVSESFGGWGIKAKLPTGSGVRVK